jgi:hypothetical protein
MLSNANGLEPGDYFRHFLEEQVAAQSWAAETAAYEEDEERGGARAAQLEAMRCAIGVNLDDEILGPLLDAAGGNEEVALQVFFAESRRATDSVRRGRGKAETREGELAAGWNMHSEEKNVFSGPRKPFDDLAFLLGNGLDPVLLAPIAVEFEGDIPKAVEAYFERADQHSDSASERAQR